METLLEEWLNKAQRITVGNLKKILGAISGGMPYGILKDFFWSRTENSTIL